LAQRRVAAIVARAGLTIAKATPDHRERSWVAAFGSGTAYTDFAKIGANTQPGQRPPLGN
jgi:predicted regulator of Ras-like GTPase activity (Roadblock/LC7/MglB family)